jgi:DNA polymerase III epsilon subunit-like protein
MDVETTVLSLAMGNRVVKIGPLVHEGRRDRTFSRLVNPGIAIPPVVRQIHCISNADVADCPAFHEIADEVAAILDGAWPVGHNLRFDLGFVAMELALAGVCAQPAGCPDTCQLVRAVWELPDYRLDALARVLGIRAKCRT